MATPSHLCERARTWASLRADGELSELEGRLLAAHLGRCVPCRAFARRIDAVADVLRSARPARPATLTLVLPRRSRTAIRVFQTAAATVAVVACGTLAAIVSPGNASRAAKPVAMVASAESPDRLRELRRPGLVRRIGAAPRNQRLPVESV
jgi:acyl-CoA synthetase (AMP-forming)/AMP-acid ligase II